MEEEVLPLSALMSLPLPKKRLPRSQLRKNLLPSKKKTMVQKILSKFSMSGQEQEADLPVWQREHIFPAKPKGPPFGVLLRERRSQGLRRNFRNWKRT